MSYNSDIFICFVGEKNLIDEVRLILDTIKISYDDGKDVEIISLFEVSSDIIGEIGFIKMVGESLRNLPHNINSILSGFCEDNTDGKNISYIVSIIGEDINDNYEDLGGSQEFLRHLFEVGIIREINSDIESILTAAHTWKK